MRFARVLGSGRNAGFGLVPGLDVQGVLAAFDSLDTAQAWSDRGEGLQDYADRAVDHLRMTLRVTSSRGSWGGATMSPAPLPTASEPSPAPGRVVAVLTRASIRPAHLAAFWRHSPPAERDLACARGCRLAVGLGEAPLLRQATFSLWDDAASMVAYARGGAHGEAIRSAWKTGYFSESMFVRFAPLRMCGHWPGVSRG
jgi:spheroidene monooxygenase